MDAFAHAQYVPESLRFRCGRSPRTLLWRWGLMPMAWTLRFFNYYVKFLLHGSLLQEGYIHIHRYVGGYRRLSMLPTFVPCRSFSFFFQVFAYAFPDPEKTAPKEGMPWGCAAHTAGMLDGALKLFYGRCGYCWFFSSLYALGEPLTLGCIYVYRVVLAMFRYLRHICTVEWTWRSLFTSGC